MATDNKPAKAPAVQAFYTPAKAKGPAVEIYVNPQVEGKRIPEFGGKVGGKQVAFRIRNSAKGNFMGVTETVKHATEKDDQGRAKLIENPIGRANLIVTDKGQPRLVINLDASKDEPIWASVRKGNDELMKKAGLDVEKIATVRAQRATAAASNDSAPAKKSAPKAA